MSRLRNHLGFYSVSVLAVGISFCFSSHSCTALTSSRPNSSYNLWTRVTIWGVREEGILAVASSLGLASGLDSSFILDFGSSFASVFGFASGFTSAFTYVQVQP